MMAIPSGARAATAVTRPRQRPATRTRSRWCPRDALALPMMVRLRQQTDFGQPWCPPERNAVVSKDTGTVFRGACLKKKRPRGTRPFRELYRHTRCRLKLLRRFASLWSSWLRGGGLGSCRTSRRSGSGRGRYTRLRVIELHHGFCDVTAVAVPQDRALRPGIRGVDNHGKPSFLRVLHNHRCHLLQNALENLFLLVLRIFLGVLYGTVKRLFLGLDLFHEGGAGVLV